MIDFFRDHKPSFYQEFNGWVVCWFNRDWRPEPEDFAATIFCKDCVEAHEDNFIGPLDLDPETLACRQCGKSSLQEKEMLRCAKALVQALALRGKFNVGQ